MAKQSKKVIEERKKALTQIGYSANEISLLLERIEQEPPSVWMELFEDLKKKKEDAIPFTEAEHIPNEEGDAIASKILVPTMDSAKDVKALRDNPLVKAIASFEKQYKGLTFAGLEDKTGIEKVKAAKKVVQKTRTWITKTEDALKAPYIRGSKDIKAVADEFRAMIAVVEDPLDSEMDRLKALLEEEETRKTEEAEKEGNHRVSVLKEAGMKFDGQFYCIAERSMDLSSIKAMTTEAFDDLVDKVKADKQRIDTAEAEAIAMLKKERVESRGNMLVSIGLVFAEIDGKGSFSFENEHYKITVLTEVLADEEDGVFMKMFEGISGNISRSKTKLAEDAEKKAKERTVALRSKLIIAIGMDRVDWMPGTSSPGFYFKNTFAECRWPLTLVETESDEEFDKGLEIFEKEITDAKAKAIQQEKDDAAKQQLSQDRGQQLVALGMTRAPQQSCFIFNLPDTSLGCNVAYGELTGQSVEQWETTIKDVKAIIAKIREQQQAFEDKAAKDKKDREEKEARDIAIFQERQYKLVNLGMVIVGNVFTVKNEFGDNATIPIDEVKAIDEDTWPSRLIQITEAVEGIKKLTISKRQAKIEEAEALKPKVQQVKEYFAAILDVKIPNVDNGDWIVALSDFSNDLCNLIDKTLKVIDPETE